jgi:hypothetical protein
MATWRQQAEILKPVPVRVAAQLNAQKKAEDSTPTVKRRAMKGEHPHQAHFSQKSVSVTVKHLLLPEVKS